MITIKDSEKKGFASIVEVIVTSVIFIIATAGIISTVAMLKPHGRGSAKRIEAAYIGKGIMDELRKDVHATTTVGQEFFGPGLTPGAHPAIVIGDYTVNYTVTAVNANLRKLTMTITWPDP